MINMHLKTDSEPARRLRLTHAT